MLTVGDVRQLIETLPDDLLVVVSSDAEGNSFSPLAELTLQRYLEHSTWSGELVSEEDEGDFTDEPIDELDFDDGAYMVYDVLCIWPTN